MTTIEYERFDVKGLPPGTRILEQVAETTGVDVLTLPPLYDVIAPAALDVLFQAGGRYRQGTFHYLDYEVTVRGGDDIELRSANG